MFLLFLFYEEWKIFCDHQKEGEQKARNVLQQKIIVNNSLQLCY